MPIRPRSTFSAAADRLQRMVQDIKHQQYDATGLRQIPLPPAPGDNPDAEGLRRFAAIGVKPGRNTGPLRSFAPLSSFAPETDRRGAPKKPVFAGAADSESQPPEVSSVPDRRDGHIGARLGKAGPPRGLFNRLFRRDN